MCCLKKKKINIGQLFQKLTLKKEKLTIMTVLWIMKDFPSKELNKTFESIYFLNELSDQPIPSAEELAEQQHTGKVTTDKNESISVTPVDGGVTIAELFKNKKDYADKEVIVTGQVTKVNTGIMGKNWLHIQDGTSDGENYDLTLLLMTLPQWGMLLFLRVK